MLSPFVAAAISGGCAGSVQALAAAPAENVRIVLEGGQARGSWSVAWREVFSGTESLASHSPEPARHRDEVRKIRHWVREVRGMAGKGWQGLGFGVAKDSCGFAVFFAIFDVSRRTAAGARTFSERVLETMSVPVSARVRTYSPRVVHSTAIVMGGLLAGISYEFICRPFDVARRCINASVIERHHMSIASILVNKVEADGILSFFRDPTRTMTPRAPTYTWLRTLGRVGPWGVAFLAWENFGPNGL
ncbi:hypothetical protein K439DRAFT_1636374 [Ramaria rubella]|nr:hypothetical protein K439DRAFT_1636374 [Ramaria rubella]